MKKLLLIPALLSASIVFAEPKKIEISPLIGYNFAEGNLGFEDNGYMAYGLEVQLNSENSSISPELSVIYSNKGSAAYKNLNYGSNIVRVALNGVKTYEEIYSVVPFAKLGAGVEMISVDELGNEDSLFIDAGAGFKVPFSDAIALKFEALYMVKYNDNRIDSNAIAFAGLNFAFGDFAQKEAPVVAPVETLVVPPIPVIPVVKDHDNDGVIDSMDRCLNTLAGVKVDSNGCKIDGDIDKDGVKDSIDKCSDTPTGAVVNSEGCSKLVNLNVQFENNSNNITTNSHERIEKFANFLNIHTNYEAKIVGYTDSVGNKYYNQKLSLKRADSVKSSLVEKGIAATRITISGMGESNPTATNSTKEGRAKNRRIEAELIKK